MTDREADEAAAFIRRNRDKPFFLHLAHYAVHTPIQAKKPLVQRYRNKKKTAQKNARYAAMVHSVDEAMGKVLAALKANGVADKTLVIFTSDNGGLLGPTHNAPLRSGKGYPYEGGIRVPLIVRWPGKVEPGSVSRTPVTSVDYLPTILHAAKLPAATGAIDGVSLVDHLCSGDHKTIPRRDLFWHFPHYRGRLAPYSIIRRAEWKLIKRYEGPSFELYNLSDDLGEKKNLAAAKPDLVKQLNAALIAHLKSVDAKLPKANPSYRKPARVLLLGDSISMGYTPIVREMLNGRADVYRPMRDGRSAENCAGTTKGVQHIDAWLAADGGKWDVIHFNFGLHDLKRVHPKTRKNSTDPNHANQAPIETYERQLRAIVAKLKKTGAKLVFATTTPVPKGVRPHRDSTDVLRYNAVAFGVMAENGIAIDDLYAAAFSRLAKIQRKADVHFTRQGSRFLAQKVAASLRKVLPSRRK